MIYLSPYRNVPKDESEAGTSTLICLRNQLGSKMAYARIYCTPSKVYYYNLPDFTTGSFIDLKYTMHLLDIELQRRGCIFLSEEKFTRLEVLK